MTRKLGATVKPVMDVTVNNGKWSIVSVSTFKTINMDFELDKEFDETTPDGRQMKVFISFSLLFIVFECIRYPFTFNFT